MPAVVSRWWWGEGVLVVFLDVREKRKRRWRGRVYGAGERNEGEEEQ
jgi:hypothetical protein